MKESYKRVATWCRVFRAFPLYHMPPHAPGLGVRAGEVPKVMVSWKTIVFGNCLIHSGILEKAEPL
jgi:hypothetical protein